MALEKFKDIPFPCFMLDRELNITETSIGHNFIGKNFSQLISESEQNILKFFIEFMPNSISMIFNMKINALPSDYRIYKYVDGDNNLYLFCHQLKGIRHDILPLINFFRKKLIEADQKIIKNKQMIEKIKKEYDQLAFQLDYFSNIGKLAAGIAHEIRNPLTSVKGFIQLMKPFLEKIGKEEYAKIAMDEIDRANLLIQEFLNAAKPREQEFACVEINQIIKDVGILFESEANLKNIIIKTKLAPENPVIYGDKNQIKQVIINLLKNSIEAINQVKNSGGIIYLCTEVEQKEVFVYIRDNGCGMSREEIEQAFDPFFTTKSTGTGLGLSICSKIIDEHGGSIQVDSIKGKGTTFKLLLPMQEKKLYT